MVRRKKSLMSLFLLMLIFGILFSGCGLSSEDSKSRSGVQSSGSENKSSTRSNITAPEKIKIGAVVPLTGKESKIGMHFKMGYELAVKEVNDAGGIYLKEFDKKVPVELIMLDDQTDQTKTVSLFERLATVDKVDAMLGGYSTPLIMAQSVVPERYKIPYVNGGGASSSIYNRGMKYVFGTLAPMETLGMTTMDVLKQAMDEGKITKPARIIVLWENTDHGKEYLSGIKDWIKENSSYAEIIMNESFEIYSSDFSSLLTKVKNANGTVMLVDARLPDYTLMHRQYTEMGLYHEMVSYGARGPDKDAREALGSASDYIFAGAWWSKALPYPQVKDFVEKYQEFTKAQGNELNAEWYSAMSYVAATALFKAIKDAGNLNKENIRDALANLKMENSIVPGQVLTFGPNGQADLPYVVIQNKPDGKSDIVYPEDSKTGDLVAPIPKK